MRNKYMLIGVVGIVVGVLLSSAVFVLAGSVDSPSAPGATSSYTLEEIYNRLYTGAAGAQSTFTEPAAGPGTGTMHTTSDIMGVAPEVDDTNGAGVADVANGKTFWGLTSGAWGLQTGTGTGGATYEAGVPKTGQTTSYATGDDGDLQKGVAWPTPRFTDNGDGTVTDNLTGLIWLKNANCFGTSIWTQALTDANTLNSGECGLSDGSSEGDWRLPNVRELFSLIDYSQVNPALPNGHPFDNVQSDLMDCTYWSSTTDPNSEFWAATVRFFNSGVGGSPKTESYYVWPVRGGQ